MLRILTWTWGTKYAPHYVERLRSAVARNLEQEHEFIVCRPKPQDEHLTKIPGCFARLRTFDPAWQHEHGIEPGDRIVCMDLDMVVTGPLDGLFDRPETFCILQGVNSSNPCRYNGSVWMLRAGHHADVWHKFTLRAASDIGFFIYPEDQRWMEHMIPDAGAFGPHTGCYGFQKPRWNTGDRLPGNARLVAFFGKRDPVDYRHLDWVKEHWR